MYADKNHIRFHKIEFYVPPASAFPAAADMDIHLRGPMMQAAVITGAAGFSDQFRHPEFINHPGGKKIFYVQVASDLMVVSLIVEAAFAEQLVAQQVGGKIVSLKNMVDKVAMKERISAALTELGAL